MDEIAVYHTKGQYKGQTWIVKKSWISSPQDPELLNTLGTAVEYIDRKTKKSFEGTVVKLVDRPEDLDDTIIEPGEDKHIQDAPAPKKSKISILKIVPGTSAEEASAFDACPKVASVQQTSNNGNLSLDEAAYVRSQVQQYKQGRIAASTQTDHVTIINKIPDKASFGTQTAASEDTFAKALREIHERLTKLDQKSDANTQAILQFLNGKAAPRGSESQPEKELQVLNRREEDVGRSSQLFEGDDEIPPLSERLRICHSTPAHSFVHELSPTRAESRISGSPVGASEQPAKQPHLPTSAFPGATAYNTPTPAKLDECTRKAAYTIDCRPDLREFSNGAELRISDQLCRQVKLTSVTARDFSWGLARQLYKTHELEGRNYRGGNGKQPISPRRRHAIEHAVLDYFPRKEFAEHLSLARTGINQGITNAKLKKGRDTKKGPGKEN